MTYDNSRWESYEPPELALHLLHDQGERPFLLLTGPSPTTSGTCSAGPC
jgi:hypothetical protein